MSRATKAFLLLYTTVFIFFIIHRLSQFNVHKLDYPGGYVLQFSFVKEHPSIFSSYPNKFSGIFRNSFNDQKKYSLPAVDEKDVVVLSEMNFSSFVANNQYVLVNFHAPWCPWSRKLSPEYALAATELKGEVLTANVDSSKERVLALMRYRIYAYPTICFFAGGVKVESYNGNKSWDAIANWTRAMVDLSIYAVSSIEQAEELLLAESTICLGFFDYLEGLESEELAAASKLHIDVIFYQTDSADVAKTFQIDPQVKPPALILLEKESKDLSNFNGPFTKSAIANFVYENKIPPVTALTKENAPLFLNSPKKQLWLFALTNDLKVTSMFQKAAKALKGKLLFVYAQMDCEGVKRQIAQDFGITGHTPGEPRVVAFAGNVNAKKFVLNDELTLRNIKSFAENFLEDNLSSESDTISETILRLPSMEL